MAATLAVVNCSQLVTLAGPNRPRVGAEMGKLSIVEDGAMMVRDGRVERTGARAEIERLAGADCEVLDAGDRVVMPGFVDAHAHPVFAGTAPTSSSAARRARLTKRSPPRAEAYARPCGERARRARISCSPRRSRARSGSCGRARRPSRRSRATD